MTETEILCEAKHQEAIQNKIYKIHNPVPEWTSQQFYEKRHIELESVCVAP